jgi:adenine-specific DNA-methyltransferase
MPTLDWLDREQAMRRADGVPYRLLEHVSTHGDPAAGNLLIQGDNLEALKALLPLYRGRVKCIFIDPPYNTQSAFEHYDDNLEHSQWLSMMYVRLLLLRELLAEDGSIWITIDDNEGHYLKVLMDEIFDRRNFVATIAWQKVFAKKNKALISGSHDHVLVFARSVDRWSRNLLPRDPAQLKAFRNPDNDPRGRWQSVAYSVQSEDAERRKAYRYPIRLPSGREVEPPQGRHWNGLPDRTDELRKDNRLWFGVDGDSPPRSKVFLEEVQEGVVPDTWWDHEFAGNNQDSKKEMLALFPDIEPFGTPKPERLLLRILTIASDEGDLVMDSFLGSGTTSAVAHKINRRYIGIEMGEHAITHCAPRLQKVIEGEQGGISELVEWKGGGGFQLLRLGETVFDEAGAINPKVRFATLASFIWLQETRFAASQRFISPLLGVHGGTACYLLFNGILGDKRPDGGNVLTGAVLNMINKKFRHDGPKVIYGESCRLGDTRLEAASITFKHIPYDVKAW